MWLWILLSHRRNNYSWDNNGGNIKILITGSSSFVGKHLCEKLKGNQIYACPHEFLERIKVLDLSVCKIDYIFNLMSYGNHYNQIDDFETVRANINKLYMLLICTRLVDYKAFINFSTSSVALPYQTFYSATKMAGEYLIKAFVNKYNKPVVSVRPFTIIGEGDSEDHLVPTLIRSCLNGEKMDFVKQPHHDYIGVDDVVKAVLLVAKHAKEFKGKSIDIGTGKSTSNNDIRLLIEKYTGKKANINVVKKMREYDTKKWIANPKELKDLGWCPQPAIQVIKKMVNAMIPATR